jgi:hypothetical protein
MWSCCCVLLLGAACGVRAYPHDVAHQDATHDFGPTGQGGSRAPVDAGPGDGAVAYAGPRDASSADAAEGGQATDSGMDMAPAQADIELGGVQLRKQDVLAFIHFGHSNMAGYGKEPANLRAYNFTDIEPHAWKYRVGSPPQPALEPTGRTDVSAAGGAGSGGPGVALVKQAAARAPHKYFVSVGYGMVSANCSQFLPGSLYYEDMIKSAMAIKGHVTFAAVVVMLGNTEIHGTDADRANFPNCLNTIVSAIREAVDAPDLPLLLSDFELEGYGMYARDGELAQKIIPMLAKVPSVIENSALVPADGTPMQDDHHFNLEGHQIWTRRLLDIMQTKGWAPWMTSATTAQ